MKYTVEIVGKKNYGTKTFNSYEESQIWLRERRSEIENHYPKNEIKGTIRATYTKQFGFDTETRYF